MIQKKSIEKGVSFNIVLQMYFFEGFLDRLAHSRYHDKFILKGGFWLSNLIGVHQRTTLDMDFNVEIIPLSPDQLKKIILDIIRQVHTDGIVYRFINISEIMNLRRYKGYQIAMIGTFGSIRVPFKIDIAHGDPITPHKMNYDYSSMVLEKKISIHAYNLETFLAEKIQTIFDKRLGNSRLKDFYDIYILGKLKDQSLDYKLFKEAIINTFQYRATSIDLREIMGLLEMLKSDNEVKKRWVNYVHKNAYVESIAFEDVIAEINRLLVNLINIK